MDCSVTWKQTKKTGKKNHPDRKQQSKHLPPPGLNSPTNQLAQTFSQSPQDASVNRMPSRLHQGQRQNYDAQKTVSNQPSRLSSCHSCFKTDLSSASWFRAACRLQEPVLYLKPEKKNKTNKTRVCVNLQSLHTIQSPSWSVNSADCTPLTLHPQLYGFCTDERKRHRALTGRLQMGPRETNHCNWLRHFHCAANIWCHPTDQQLWRQPTSKINLTLSCRPDEHLPNASGNCFRVSFCFVIF